MTYEELAIKINEMTEEQRNQQVMATGQYLKPTPLAEREPIFDLGTQIVLWINDIGL